MKEIGTTLAKQDSLRIATLGREANKQDSTISEIRKNILADVYKRQPLAVYTFCHHVLFFTDRKAQSSLARRILTGSPAK